MSAAAELRAARASTADTVAALEADLASMMSAAEGSNADDEHDPEGATLAFERQQLIAVLAQTRARVQELDEALARLDSPAWGRCERCQAPIGSERLAARPSTTRCVTCASAR